MNGPLILDQLRTDLAKELSSRQSSIPTQEPLAIDPWLAMSLLQKAVRRGKEEWALGAAAALLAVSPERLWRRLCVIAFEDIGLADIQLVGLVVSIQNGKTSRKHLGGEWVVASHLIQRMCQSPKCRAADDLLFIAEYHPRLENLRLKLTYKTNLQLWNRVASAREIDEKALALWYAIGTNRAWSDTLRDRKGDWKESFNFLASSGFPDTIVEIAREGFRKSQDILCPLLVLLERVSREESKCYSREAQLEDVLVNGVPSWAYDMHVREGKKALALFLERDCAFSEWHARNVGKIRETRIAGNMLFRIESSVVDRRLDWSLANHLLSETRGCYSKLTSAQATEGLTILRDDLHLLNEVRHDVVSNLR